MAGLQSYPVLEGVARCLEEYRWAAWLLDRDLNVVWISPEFQDIVGSSAERLCGRHFIEAALSEEVRSIVTERSLFRAGAELIPFYVRFTPGGRQGVKALLKAQLGAGAEDIVDEIPDDEPGPVIGSSLNVRLTEGMEPVHANFLGVQLRSADGALIGHMIMFVGTLPFRFLPLLARGDEATLARTVRLATPGHRQAAILFADFSHPARCRADSRANSTSALFETWSRRSTSQSPTGKGSSVATQATASPHSSSSTTRERRPERRARRSMLREQ